MLDLTLTDETILKRCKEAKNRAGRTELEMTDAPCCAAFYYPPIKKTGFTIKDVFGDGRRRLRANYQLRKERRTTQIVRKQ